MINLGTKKMVLLSIFISLAMVLSYIEAMIPLPIVFPGVKLGLANIITLLVIVYFGFTEALLVVIIRCFLVAAFAGGFSQILFSITGGILSTIVMFLCKKYLSRLFSLVGISILGSIAHNIGQIFSAWLVIKDFAVLSYLPALLFSGIIMGVCVGITTKIMYKHLNKLEIFHGV